MKNTTSKMGVSTKIMALVLCVSSLAVVAGVTGCTSTGSRYKQSTGEYIDDHGLSSKVKSALSDDTQFKYEDVKVTTFKSVVQLNGFVNTKDQKSRAEDIAKKVDGVKTIENNITVKE